MEYLGLVISVVIGGSILIPKLVKKFRSSSTEESGCGGCSGCGDSKKNAGSCTPLLLLFAVLSFPSHGFAADTVETFDKGTFDVEMYVGVQGLGQGRRDMGVSSELVAGVGLLERFSAYGVVAFGADGFLENGETALAMGVFGTPVDTTHFDLDLMLDLSEFSGRFSVSPGIEINVDSRDDMSGLGMYARSGTPFHGTCNRCEEEGRPYLFSFDVMAGVYVSIYEEHQLLVEVDGVVTPSGEDGSVFGWGQSKLGYNALLTDTFELITQLCFPMPTGATRAAFGAMVGFVATI